MNRDAFIASMSRYMPIPACELAFDWLQDHPAKLRISKPRKTKLGDFRIDFKTNQASISVNGDLNPMAFTITLAHEVAHLIDYRTRGTLKMPHGKSWQAHYQRLLAALRDAGVFPEELKPAIEAHIVRPTAASCSDAELLQELRRYDREPVITLDDIPEGTKFKVNGRRTFVKGALRRTRYRCLEADSGKTYLVHRMTAVEVLEA